MTHAKPYRTSTLLCCALALAGLACGGPLDETPGATHAAERAAAAPTAMDLVPTRPGHSGFFKGELSNPLPGGPVAPEPLPEAPQAHPDAPSYAGEVRGVTALRAIGKACSTDEQCDSGWCVAWCTRECVTDADCGDGVCARVSSGRAMCFPRCETHLDCGAFEMAMCHRVQSTCGRAERVCSF